MATSGAEHKRSRQDSTGQQASYLLRIGGQQVTSFLRTELDEGPALQLVNEPLAPVIAIDHEANALVIRQRLAGLGRGALVDLGPVRVRPACRATPSETESQF